MGFWRGLLAALIVMSGCDATPRTATPTGPRTNAPACSVPICDPQCLCDRTHSCDPGCSRCDPECGQCRADGACRQASDGGTADAGGTGGPIQLTVVDAVQSDEVGGADAAPGERFFVVSLRLANNSTVAFPLAPQAFSLTTQTGLALPGDAVTAQHADGCPAAATLTMGHDITCTIVFRGPDHDSQSLTYSAPNGPSATVALSVRRCVQCGSRCVDVATDPENCGACGVRVADGTCVEGRPGCSGGRQACGAQCVDLRTDPAHCGQCNAAIDPNEMTCVNGLPRCRFAGNSACGLQCVNLQRDLDHCGGCNQTCAYECDDGVCGEWLDRPTPTPCSVVCGTRTCLQAGGQYEGACANGSVHRIFFRSCGQLPPSTFTPPDQPSCVLPFTQSVCFCAP